MNKCMSENICLQITPECFYFSLKNSNFWIPRWKKKKSEGPGR